MKSNYTSLELEAFRTFYKKYPCIKCDKCLSEAESALTVVKKYFTEKEIFRLLQERSRAPYDGRGGVYGELKVKELIGLIYVRLRVDLESLK